MGFGEGEGRTNGNPFSRHLLLLLNISACHIYVFRKCFPSAWEKIIARDPGKNKAAPCEISRKPGRGRWRDNEHKLVKSVLVLRGRRHSCLLTQ